MPESYKSVLQRIKTPLAARREPRSARQAGRALKGPLSSTDGKASLHGTGPPSPLPPSQHRSQLLPGGMLSAAWSKCLAPGDILPDPPFSAVIKSIYIYIHILYDDGGGLRNVNPRGVEVKAKR